MDKYDLVIDKGKPDNETITGKDALFKRLDDLEKEVEAGDYLYISIYVGDRDISDAILQEYEDYKICNSSLAEAIEKKDAALIREIELRAREGKTIRII